MDIPNNYMLEVEQLGNCILNGETPHVSAEFSIQTAETMDMVLKSCGY
ncbi:MAG: hypothetical protein ACLRMN_02970 [Mediterraneibacter gnavus]|jgi:hypothetical protein